MMENQRGFIYDTVFETGPTIDGQRVIDESGPRDPPPQTTATSSSCSITSADQIPALQQFIAAMHGPDFLCPLCDRPFHVKKTLVRHVNAAIGAFNGSPFVCRAPACGRRFARKDILTRHLRSQHDSGRTLVRCQMCGREVRPRSLRLHQETQSCINAGSRGDAVLAVAAHDDRRRPNDSWEAFSTLHSHLHDILDCVLLTAWMFTTLKPWGPDPESTSLWLGRPPPPPIYEVEKLKALFLRTMQNAIRAPDMASNGHLLDAIAAIKAVTTMTQGWEFSNPHSDGYKKLAHIQIRRMGLTRNKFVGSPPSSAWDSVLNVAVAERDRRDCKTIITRFLRLMRLATWDSVSRLTQDFTQPLDDLAVKGHTRWNTRQTFFRGYGEEVVAIYTTASSIGQEQRPVPAQC